MSESLVRLRPITEADLPDYVRWFNDPEVTQFLAMESGSFTLEGEREWLARISSPEDRGRHWAIEVDGRHIGNCGLIPDEAGQIAGFGIAIGEKAAWGKGYGTAAVREVLRIGFGEIGLHRIELNAFSPNARAIRCYEKCGFRHEGVKRQAFFKRGVWLDRVIMAILREEWEAMQVSPADGLCQLGPEHVDEVIAVWSDVELWSHFGEDCQSIAVALARNREFACGWRVSGELVGTAVASWDGFRGKLYRVAVRPAYQRQGIGTALVSELERRLATAGARQLNLLQWRPNADAYAFYTKLGYEPNEEMRLMRKRLGAASE